MNLLKIGTRGSPLALVQARWVETRIRAEFPETHIRLEIIKTTADRDTTTSIRSGSSTGVFVREIEESLLAGKIDLAVHSMKDLPTRIPEALDIGAIPQREDPRDALIAVQPCGSLRDLPPGAAIGTGSVRRQAQVLALRPDLRTVDMRGNVQTRLRKLESGNCEAIILACAGLNRLGLNERIRAILDLSEMLPAPGQGALAIEIRKGDSGVAGLLASIHDPDTAAAVLAERAFLRRMGGGCNSPVAVHADLTGDSLVIDALVATPDGATVIRNSIRCTVAEGMTAATILAEKLLSMGGAKILQSLS